MSAPERASGEVCLELRLLLGHSLQACPGGSLKPSQRVSSKRDGNTVTGVEKILGQNPFEPPTRQTKRSPRHLFHYVSKEERHGLVAGFMAFLGQYRIASEASRVGPPPPKRPPSPPTLRITVLDSGSGERGESRSSGLR